MSNKAIDDLSQVTTPGATDKFLIRQGSTDYYEELATSTRTFTNKTLTAPTITSAIITSPSISSPTIAGGSATGLALSGGTATGVAIAGSTIAGSSATSMTITDIVLNGTATGTAIKDEDDMASDSSQHLSSQQSIKAYVDSGTITMTNKTITATTNTVYLTKHYDTGWLANEMGSGTSANFVDILLGDDNTSAATTNVINHGLGVGLHAILVKILISPTATGSDTNAWEAYSSVYDAATANLFEAGINIFVVDNDNIKVRTGNNGVPYITTAGSFNIVTTDNYAYRIIVVRLF